MEFDVSEIVSSMTDEDLKSEAMQRAADELGVDLINSARAELITKPDPPKGKKARKPKEPKPEKRWQDEFAAFIRKGDQVNYLNEAIPTGSLSIDVGLGGGLPIGYITRIYGVQRSGKTTLCMKMAAKALEWGYEVLWVDAEMSLLPKLAKNNGLDVSRVDVVNSFDDYLTYEVVVEIVDAALQNWRKSGKRGVVIIDSLDALETKGENEADVDDAKIASAARLTSRWLKNLIPELQWSGSALVFVQQLRANLEGRYEKTKTAGGYMLEHMTHVEIALKPVKKLTKGKGADKTTIGYTIEWVIPKNKLSRAGVSGTYALRYDNDIGIDHAGEVISLGEKAKVITRAGATYKFTLAGEDFTVTGIDGMRQWLFDHRQGRAGQLLEDSILERLGVLGDMAIDEEEVSEDDTPSDDNDNVVDF